MNLVVFVDDIFDWPMELIIVGTILWPISLVVVAGVFFTKAILNRVTIDDKDEEDDE